jgi:hypothetical protein
MERIRCKKCGEFLVSAKTPGGDMDAAGLILFFKMVEQPDPLNGYVCGACGKSSSFELVETENKGK